MYLILDENKKVVGISPLQDEDTVEVSELKPLQENEYAFWNGKELEYRFNTDKQLEVPEMKLKNISLTLLSLLMYQIRPLTGEETREHTHDISVLIPCYNQSALVKEAINSCLNQTQKPSNILVLLMDEDSYKLKEELEENPIVKCYKEKQMNVCKARTYLVNKCSTDWFIFLDADDMLKEDFIEVLDKSDGAICFSNVAEKKDKLLEEREVNFLANNAPVKAIVRNLTCLMHKDVFNEYGLDEEFCKGGEDADFTLKVLEGKKYKLTVTPNTYYIYRRANEHSVLTKNTEEFAESHNRMFEKHLPYFIDELNAIYRKNCTTYNLLWLCKNYNKDNIRKWINNYTQKEVTEVNDYKLFKTKLINHYNKLLDESKRRPAIEKYDREKFIQVGEFFLNDLHLIGRSVDVIFHECNNIYDINQFFTEEKQYLINEKVYDDLKKQNLNPTEEVFYLLENYNCFTDNHHLAKNETLFTDETEEIIKNTNLPKDIKDHFLEFIKCRDDFYVCSVPMKRPMTFQLHSLCNRHCEYCFQKHHNKVISDEEVYKNFDEALTMCEEKFGAENIYPQIMGGEPTIFSEWLQKKIIERVKNYREVLLFTNGTNRTSEFFKQPNFAFEIHLVDWKGKKQTDIVSQHPCEFYILVATENDFEELKDFVSREHQKAIIMFDPSNIEYTDEEKMISYYKKLKEMTKDSTSSSALSNYLSDYDEIGIKQIRKNCFDSVLVKSFDCETRTVGLCPNDKDFVSFEEFNFTQRPSHTSCENCFNLCSYYIR